MEISTLLSYARSRLKSARESLHYAAFWDPMQRSLEYALAVDEYRRAQAEMDRVQELARSAFALIPTAREGE